MTLPLVASVLSHKDSTIAPIEFDNSASRDLLGRAADAFTGEASKDEATRALLLQLDYFDGRREFTSHRVALLRAAARFRRLFALQAPDAPALCALGAEVDPAAFGLGDGPVGYVAGTGLDFRQAFESCVGEGVEYASQFLTGTRSIAFLSEDEALADASEALRELWGRLGSRRRAWTAWTNAASLMDGELVRVPVDLCFRRPADVRDFDPPWPLSIGTGAGADPLDATLHGLLELVERDAVALWWRGGRPARIVADGSGSALLGHLRGGPTHRRSWLLDVTSDVGVPVVVAASCNGDGFGLCCGFAARLTLGQAADAAVREMVQMELAHHLSEAKRQTRGAASLSDLDRQHIERFGRIDVGKTRALHPLAPPGPPGDLPSPDGRRAALGLVRRKLEAIGLSPCVVDLTREEIGVPAVRALCPGLEAGMTARPGPRLRAAALESGLDPMTVAPL